MKIGLNVAVTSGLEDYGGSAVVRYPLWRQWGQPQLAAGRARELKAKGIQSLLCFDRASHTPYAWEIGRFAASFGLWHMLFPNPTIIEVGNEPDGTGDSSSKQTREHFHNSLRNARTIWPNAYIISGGLSAIDFEYLDGLDDLPIDAVGFHPYAQDGESVKGLIAEMRKHTKKPLVASELGQEYDDSDGAEHLRAEWLSSMLISLYEEGVEIACVYCGKQDQGPEGLVLADGTPLESWAAFTGAIPALRS